MSKRSEVDDGKIRLAQQATKKLFNSRELNMPSVYEPNDYLTARAAVRQLGELLEQIPGCVANALEAAGSGGELLSSDRLQGLAEILQNADDSGASEVRLLLRDNDLLMGHNGKKMQLRDVLGITMPWFSTKRAESRSFGRFGIGLSALRSISSKIEVHCSPYHMSLQYPILSAIEPAQFPTRFDEDGLTIFRILLKEDVVKFEYLAKWIKQWGDAGLLFLRNVIQVTLYGPEGDVLYRLSVSRSATKMLNHDGLLNLPLVHRNHVKAADGRSWLVYSSDVPSPSGVSRAQNKNMEKTTPISVALPLYEVEVGQIYAGLPVVGTGLPIFLNAQFDPLTNRRDLADTEWNQSLIQLVARVWSYAAVDMFYYKPSVAWHAMPVESGHYVEEVSAPVANLNAAIIDVARNSVASRILIEVSGRGWFGLSELAVEAKPLEGVVTENETATLLKMPATLPSSIRDSKGRWRIVLDDWREAGGKLPIPLSVEQALFLLNNTDRPVHSTIALVAAGIRDKLSDSLIELPCLVTGDEKHVLPPSSGSPDAVAFKVSPLAQELGILTVLHAQYLQNTNDNKVIIEWLQNQGVLLDGTDDRVVIQRLAMAGRSGQSIEKPFTDEQVDALRRSFESIDPNERREVGTDIGSAIMLSAYVYEPHSGGAQRREIVALPAKAYLPRSIDSEKDSFAVASDKSPGIVWLNERYAKVLKSPSGRDGIGAQRFLALLGAEKAPRPCVHSGLVERYCSSPLGLKASCEGSPKARTDAIRKRNATYTLQDWECKDLIAVVEDIACCRQAKQRRKRARALLATIGRAWDRLNEYSEVKSAKDYYTWETKGMMPAFWVWQVRDVAWLDDESGTPRKPPELRLRTRGTEAIYGEDSLDFLHKDLDGKWLERRNWKAAIVALGVCGDVTRKDLILKLKELRDETVSGTTPREQIEALSAIIYKALAESIRDSETHDDISKKDMLREFQDGDGLIFTDMGWRKPKEVFAGPSIFGQYEVFAPQIPDTGSLWEMLQLQKPSLSDCIKVLRQISRRSTILNIDDEAIQIQTLRLLEDYTFRNPITPQDRRKLSKLRLWTSQGWKHHRPIYATDDETLADSLSDRLPIWKPGGGLSQFRSLLQPLKIELIRSCSAKVIKPDSAQIDLNTTILFEAAVQQLKEDFTRNEPQLVEALDIGWDTLSKFQVHEHRDLRVSIPNPENGVSTSLFCDVPIKVDPSRKIVFVRKAYHDLPRADCGGQALATLFDGDRRRIAQAWRSAWDLAESGQIATSLELAEQKDKRRQDEIQKGMEKIQEESHQVRIDSKGQQVGKSRQQTKHQQTDHVQGIGTGTNNTKTRILVDTSTLEVVGSYGQVAESSKSKSLPKRRVKGLVEPTGVSRSPHNKTAHRNYSDIDKENTGFEIARKVLESIGIDIEDIRTQRSVGADAIDQFGN